jgi:hypothetical protein
MVGCFQNIYEKDNVMGNHFRTITAVGAILFTAQLALAATTTQTGVTPKQNVTAAAVTAGTAFIFAVGPVSGTVDTLKIKVVGPSGAVTTVILGSTATPYAYSWVPPAGTAPSKYKAKWKSTTTSVSGAIDGDVGTIKPECLPGGTLYPC